MWTAVQVAQIVVTAAAAAGTVVVLMTVVELMTVEATPAAVQEAMPTPATQHMTAEDTLVVTGKVLV